MIISSIALRLLIIAGLALACFGSGFVAGVRYEGMVRDAAELKRVRDVEIRIKEVVKWRTKIEKVFVEKLIYIDRERDRVEEEVNRHARELDDPRECWLAPERVRSINDAAGGAAGKPDGARPVPADQVAPVGEPQRRGEVGGGLGLPIPRVFRAPGLGSEDADGAR